MNVKKFARMWAHICLYMNICVYESVYLRVSMDTCVHLRVLIYVLLCVHTFALLNKCVNWEHKYVSIARIHAHIFLDNILKM